MHTLEQLQAMTDEQLDEAAALAQGWQYNSGYITGFTLQESGVACKRYHPCSNTIEGKAQAFDLIIKYGLSIFGTYMEVKKIGEPTITVGFIESDIQKAIVIASILSAQENKLAVK